MNNIYIQTLKLGFDNPDGISLNEVVEKLNIDLSNESKKYSFTTWFYTNFFNSRTEQFQQDALTMSGYWESPHLKDMESINSELSYLKGDAVNKYIDFKELEITRESSKQASYFATGSIFIAILAVIFPYIFKPNPAITTNASVLFSISLVIISVVYTYLNNRKNEPKEKNKTLRLFTINISALGLIFAILLTYLFTITSSSLVVKILGVVAIIIFVVGQIWRKFKIEPTPKNKK